MKFRLERASDWKFKEEKGVDELQDLFELMDKEGCGIIIQKNYHTDDIKHKYILTIYDGYVE